MSEAAKGTKATKRLGRDDWVAAARKTLVERGVDEVKVDRLARQMKVTRGSFYWHFQHRRDLLDALLTDWEARNYFEIAQVRARWARTTPDMAVVISIWLSEDPSVLSFDVAVRAWARRAPEVAQSVKRVDTAWIALLQDSFKRDGLSQDEALVRARITYFHQIGYWALDLEEDTNERLRLVPIYYRVLTGHDAPPELDHAIKQAVERQKPPRRTATKSAGKRVAIGPAAE